MAPHVHPTLPAQDQQSFDDGDFPQPEKDEQYTHVERLLGYAPPKPKRLWLRGIIFVVILAVVIGLGTLLLGQTHPTAKKPAANAASKPVAAAPATKQYNALSFGVSFAYPATWSLVDDGTDPVTITSPPMPLKNAAGGKTVQGRVVLTVQHKQIGLAAFKSGDSVAAITSQIVVYANPSSDQRAQTYISFLNYASTKANGIDAIYVTGDAGYQKGQDIPEADIVRSDPLVSATFAACQTKACGSSDSPLTIAPSQWNDKSFRALITNFVASLVV